MALLTCASSVALQCCYCSAAGTGTRRTWDADRLADCRQLLQANHLCKEADKQQHEEGSASGDGRRKYEHHARAFCLQIYHGTSMLSCCHKAPHMAGWVQCRQRLPSPGATDIHSVTHQTPLCLLGTQPLPPGSPPRPARPVLPAHSSTHAPRPNRHVSGVQRPTYRAGAGTPRERRRSTATAVCPAVLPLPWPLHAGLMLAARKAPLHGGLPHRPSAPAPLRTACFSSTRAL
jgi:hypothetical protein